MEAARVLSVNDIYLIATGIVMGTVSRLVTLKVDFRQIPTYPSAYFNNVILGLIASALGAIAVPAILARDFVAVTFLTVAVQQFRDVRKAEQESLEKLEHSEYTQRGEAYIDGIAKTFESRNYICLLTAFLTVLAMEAVRFFQLRYTVLTGAAAGAAVLYFCYRFTKGRTVGAICTARPGNIEIRGSDLYVDDMFVTSLLGSEQSRELFLREGVAAVLTAKDTASRVTLENFGQRQAILFEVIRSLGVKRYQFMERNFATGKVILAFVPILNDPDLLLETIRKTPVLESSRKVKRTMRMGRGS